MNEGLFGTGVDEVEVDFGDIIDEDADMDADTDLD
jgi:hypothetical protein